MIKKIYGEIARFVSDRIRNFSAGTLLYTIAVIIWGAYVRATGSGAGCGDHWPLCNGEVIPRAERLQTIIEFAHRASSGLNLILVVLLYVGVRRVADRGTVIRRSAFLATVAIFLEAALGAGLVLLKYVEFDQSVGRAVSIALHLVNTLFLVASLSSVVFYSQNPAQAHERRPWFPRVRAFWAPLGLFVLLSMMGAIAALGDTLFPAQSVLHGIEQDLNPSAHFLIRLRVFHPILAVAWMVLAFAWANRFDPLQDRKIRNAFLGVLTAQFLVGILNWVLMAPHVLQMLHLAMAEATFVLFWWSGLIYETRKSSQSP